MQVGSGTGSRPNKKEDNMDGWFLLFLLGFGVTAGFSIWPRNTGYRFPLREDD